MKIHSRRGVKFINVRFYNYNEKGEGIQNREGVIVNFARIPIR